MEAGWRGRTGAKALQRSAPVSHADPETRQDRPLAPAPCPRTLDVEGIAGHLCRFACSNAAFAKEVFESLFWREVYQTPLVFESLSYYIVVHQR